MTPAEELAQKIDDAEWQDRRELGELEKRQAHKIEASKQAAIDARRRELNR